MTKHETSGTPAPQAELLVQLELRQGRETLRDSIFGRYSCEFVAHMVRDDDRLELHVRVRSQAVTDNLAERAGGDLYSRIKGREFLTFKVFDYVVCADQVEEISGHLEFLCSSGSPDFSQAPRLRTEPDKAPAPQPLDDVPCLINPEPESPLIQAADECFDESRRLAAHYMDALTAILLEEDVPTIHGIADQALGSSPRNGRGQ